MNCQVIPTLNHQLAGVDSQVSYAILDRDGRRDVIAAVKPDETHWLRCPSVATNTWPSHVIKVAHSKGTGTAKGIRVGDIDGNVLRQGQNPPEDHSSDI